MTRVLLVGAVLLAASVCWAQPWPEYPLPARSAPGHQATATAAKDSVNTLLNRTPALSGSRAFNTAKTWGARIFTRTNVVIGAGALITAGLQWYFDEAQRTTGTSLDNFDADAEAETGTHYGLRKGHWGASNQFTAGYCGTVAYDNHCCFQGAGYGYENDEAGCLVWLEAYLKADKGWQSVTFAVESTAQGGAKYYDIYYNGYPPGESPPYIDLLEDYVAENPDAKDGVSDAMNDYVDEGADVENGGPDDVFGDGGSVAVETDQDGVGSRTQPSVNQWWDNPYVDTGVDTDGDGYADWEEEVAGTDPADENDTPTVSPDLNKDSDGDGYPDWFEESEGTDPNDANDYPTVDAPGSGTDTDGDGFPDDFEEDYGTDPNDANDYPTVDEPAPSTDSDGDGIPDEFDPCRFDASNGCAEASETQELPDDYAREGTQQDILNELQKDGDVTAPGLTEPTVNPEAWTPMENTSTVWTQAAADMQTEVDDLWNTMQGKLPFGFASWVPTPGSIGAGDACPEWSISFVADTTMDIKVCENPVDDFMRTTGRAMLLAVAYLGFLFTVIRRVQSA